MLTWTAQAAYTRRNWELLLEINRDRRPVLLLALPSLYAEQLQEPFLQKQQKQQQQQQQQQQ